MGAVQGDVTPGFEPVRDLFERQFEAGEHIGAGVTVYYRGKPVVDIWGGVADQATGAPWERDTLAVSYSTTKGLVAACVHLLADRGLISYDDRVATYWPEFAAHGKESITVSHVLTHQAGIPQIPTSLTADDLVDWKRVIDAVEELEPVWEPGTDTGYHALTFGWLTGEIVRRVDGRTVGAFLRDEIAAPFGLRDMFIGAPDETHGRIARLEPPVVTPEMQAMRQQIFPPESLMARALAPREGNLNDVLNSPRGRRSEIPAISGVMTARDLARLYACLGNGGELDGARIVSEATVRAMSEQRSFRPDRVLTIPIGWAMGYMTGGSPGWPQGPRTTAFGHAGFGGSIGYCDPEIGLAFGLVLNKLGTDLIGYGRSAALADAARACAEAAG